MSRPEFRKWPSVPRLFRDITITEKIDGTNACIIVNEDGSEVWAQSRKRVMTQEDDHFGFAHWVNGQSEELAHALGPGYHYGEWWGHGIQRGYDLPKGKRYFSLFNTQRWGTAEGWDALARVKGLSVVPVLYSGTFSEWEIEHALDRLAGCGSIAAPGFGDPEGIVVRHHDADQLFKITLDNNDMHKQARQHVALARVA